MYQRKVDVDMLNAVKSVLADVSSISPSSEQRAKKFVRAKRYAEVRMAIYNWAQLSFYFFLHKTSSEVPNDSYLQTSLPPVSSICH